MPGLRRPRIFFAYPWKEDHLLFVHRVKSLMEHAGMEVLNRMLRPGVDDIPDKELLNILGADAVGALLIPEPETFVASGIVREIAAAKRHDVPIFVMVNHAYTGHGVAVTELNGYVDGPDSVKQWFEYDKQATINDSDDGRFHDWLVTVCGHLLSIPVEKTEKRQQVQAALYAQKIADSVSLDRAIDELWRSARISVDAFLAKLAEVAARLVGSSFGVVGVARRAPGCTRLMLGGFWSSVQKSDSVPAEFNLLSHGLGYSETDTTGIMGYVARTKKSVIAGRLQAPGGPDEHLRGFFVDPGGLGIQSEITVPVLNDGDHVALVIDVEDRVPDRFLEVHRTRLETLARTASLMYDHLMFHEFSALVISLARGDQSRFGPILDHAVQSSCADFGFIAIRDAAGPMRVRELTPARLAPSVREQFEKGLLHVEDMEGITGKALSTQKVIAEGDLSTYEGPYLDWWPGVRAEIVFPVADLSGGAEAILDLEYLEPQQFTEAFKKTVDLKAKLLLVAIPSEHRRPIGSRSIAQLIEAGEGLQIEFKGSFSYAKTDERRNEELQHAVARTVCGFMNRVGGTLLIGVQDDGKVLGISEELGKGYGASYDRFLRAIEEYLITHLEPGVWRDLYYCSIETCDGREICCIHVVRSDSRTGKPIFCKDQKGRPVFYVRSGNRTEALAGPDLLDYIRNRWPEDNGPAGGGPPPPPR